MTRQSKHSFELCLCTPHVISPTLMVWYEPLYRWFWEATSALTQWFKPVSSFFSFSSVPTMSHTCAHNNTLQWKWNCREKKHYWPQTTQENAPEGKTLHLINNSCSSWEISSQEVHVTKGFLSQLLLKAGHTNYMAIGHHHQQTTT